MRKIFIVVVALLLASSLMADVTNKSNSASSQLAGQGIVMVTTTDANGNVTVVSVSVVTPSAAAARVSVPPSLPASTLANPLLYSAAMRVYCQSNLAGCGPSVFGLGK